MRPYRLTAIALAVAALVAAGCSEETSEEAAKKEAESTADLRSEEPSAPPETSGAQRSKPKIRIPNGPAPTKLEVDDLIEGKGRAAKAGDTLSVNYVGVSYSSGKEFDTSFGKQPLEFPLGAGQVIRGWDEGVAGMRPGGRRVLVIPPDMAYGPDGAPPAIGPNETLVFVVDLERVR